jgi:hypothetical protein
MDLFEKKLLIWVAFARDMIQLSKISLCWLHKDLLLINVFKVLEKFQLQLCDD